MVVSALLPELGSSSDQMMKGECVELLQKITGLLTQYRRNVSERLQGELQTNQRAELTAILRALQKVPVDQDIRIFSDSQYSIKCVAEWYKRWEQNGWKTDKGPVKNKDLVEAIRAVIDEREELGTNTYFRWIKGHADDPGNIAADELAVRGAMLKK